MFKKLVVYAMSVIMLSTPVYGGSLPFDKLRDNIEAYYQAKAAPSEPESSGKKRFYGLLPSKGRIVHHTLDDSNLNNVKLTADESAYNSEYYTQVNDQGLTGCCWAFGNTSALEGNLNKKYGKEDSRQISWKNVAYWAWHQSDIRKDMDGADYSEAVFVQSEFDKGPPDDSDYYSFAGRGGQAQAVDCVGNGSAYLFLGGGVYSAALLYSQGRSLKADTGDDALDVDLQNIGQHFDKAKAIGGSAGDAYRVKDAYVLAADTSNTENIKKYLKEYGAGAISYYAGDDDGPYVYTSDSEAQQFENEYGEGSFAANHTITLVGWDDNIDKTKFTGSKGNGEGGNYYSYEASDRDKDDSTISESEYPPNNGAWICINSWGTGNDSGTDNGKTYISYYDASLKDSEVIFYDVYKKEAEDAPAYLWCKNSYGMEGCGFPYTVKSTAAMGIAYKAESDVTLKAISVFTAEDNAEYTLSIYGNPSITNKSVSMTENTPIVSMDLSFPVAGIHTVELEKKVGIKKDQTALVILKPKKELNSFISQEEDATEEEGDWTDEFYCGNMRLVVNASGMSLIEAGSSALKKLGNGDSYLRCLSSEGIDTDAETFNGTEFDMKDIDSESVDVPEDPDDPNSPVAPANTETYTYDYTPDKFVLTFTKSVPYTGCAHSLSGSTKRGTTPDMQIKLTLNGEEVSPQDYKVKFKNSKLISGSKGKNPEIIITLGKKFSKTAKKALKSSPVQFEIAKGDLSKNYDFSNAWPKLNKYWDKVTKITDIYEARTKTLTKLKLSKNGYKGDFIVTSITDKGRTLDIGLKGINNCTGEYTLSCEVEGGSSDGGYGDGGYGGGGGNGGWGDNGDWGGYY